MRLGEGGRDGSETRGWGRDGSESVGRGEALEWTADLGVVGRIRCESGGGLSESGERRRGRESGQWRKV